MFATSGVNDHQKGLVHQAVTTHHRKFTRLAQRLGLRQYKLPQPGRE